MTLLMDLIYLLFVVIYINNAKAWAVGECICKLKMYRMCISTGKAEAIKFLIRDEVSIKKIPQNEHDWMEVKDTNRGGSGEYKKFL